MSVPRTRTLPASGSMSPLIRRSKVDLPQPEGPTSTQNAPRSTARSRRVDGRAAVESFRDGRKLDHGTLRKAASQI